MGRFLRLVGVENTKLWKRFSTKLMVLILAAIVVGLCGLMKAESSLSQNVKLNSEGVTKSDTAKIGWKEQLRMSNKQIEEQIKTAEQSKYFSQKNSIDTLKKNLAENKYRIEHNMKPADNQFQDFWYMLVNSNMWQIVALFAIIACTALIAGEFSENTMKMTVTRPYARWQILTAKFAAILGYTVLLSVVAYLVMLGSFCLFFGTSQFGNHALLWIGGNIVDLPGIVSYLIVFGFDFLSVLVYVIFTLAICTLTRSRAFATGLSIFLMFGGTFTQLLAQHFSWGKFIFFVDTNFSSFVTTGSLIYDLTLGFSLVACFIYCVLFFAVGYFSFAKRDIS